MANENDVHTNKIHATIALKEGNLPIDSHVWKCECAGIIGCSLLLTFLVLETKHYVNIPKILSPFLVLHCIFSIEH